MRKATIVMLLVLFHGFSGKLCAQEKFGFEIGAYAGQSNWQERTFQVGSPQVTPPISLGFKYDDKVSYGTRFNLLSQGHWGGEFSYSYQKNTLNLTRQTVAPVVLGGGIHHFFYNTVFYPVRYGRSSVMPFVTAGLGLAAYQLSSDARARAADARVYALGDLKRTDNRFAFNYGAGIKANLPKHLGIRADFRHIFSDVPSYGLPKESANPAQTVFPFQGKLQMYEVSAGIYFHVLK